MDRLEGLVKYCLCFAAMMLIFPVIAYRGAGLRKRVFMFCLYSIFSKVALIAIEESEIQLSLTDTQEEEPA